MTSIQSRLGRTFDPTELRRIKSLLRSALDSLDEAGLVNGSARFPLPDWYSCQKYS